MTQNVHNFSICRANARSQMLYVNSVQLRIELTHTYPIEILSQTRRYSRKLSPIQSLTNYIKYELREKGRDLTQSYDKPSTPTEKS